MSQVFYTNHASHSAKGLLYICISQLSLSLLTVQTLTNTEDMAEAEDLMRLVSRIQLIPAITPLIRGPLSS